MSTYEHDLLTARFAALAPARSRESATLDRAGAVRPRRRRLARSLWRGGRRRRLVVALAVSVLAAAVAATAYATVRVLFLDRGFVGFPPVEATPSARERRARPELHRNEHYLELRMSVFVYADGRVIWVRQGGAPAGANKSTSGFLEQRLTPEGVELLRSKVISTGLFRHDVDLITGSAERRRPGQVLLFRGTIQARTGERLVRVRWMNRVHLHVLSDFPARTPARPPHRAGAGARTARSATRRSGSFAAGERVARTGASGRTWRPIRHLLGASAGAWAGSTSASNPTVPRSDPLPETVADVLRRGAPSAGATTRPQTARLCRRRKPSIARALEHAGLEKES